MGKADSCGSTTKEEEGGVQMEMEMEMGEGATSASLMPCLKERH